jgi:hypothetical protein
LHLVHYSYKTNPSFLDYEFVSEGPKGKIKKVVRFMMIGEDVYNLAFGDLIEKSGEINDTVITNNEDSKKVLATVAMIVSDFLLKYPDKWVFAVGSTHSRTRLYRMGITNHWHIIRAEFDVYGLLNKGWELFELRKDYDAFLVRLK